MSLHSEPMVTFKPSADILTIIGIQHQGQSSYILYGIIPRFWKIDTNAEKYEQVDEKTKVACFSPLNNTDTTIRILKQSESTNIEDSHERQNLQTCLKKIHRNMAKETKMDLKLSEEDDEKKADVIEKICNKEMEQEALKGIFELCRFYYEYYNKKDNTKEHKELFTKEQGKYGSSSQGLPLFLFQDFIQELQKNTREL